MPATANVTLFQVNQVIVTISRGNTLLLPLIWQDESGAALDFTGYTAFGQLRTNYEEDSGQVLVDLSETPDVDNNYVELDHLNGKVTARVDQSIMAGLSSRQRYFLEVKLRSGLGNITVGLLTRIKIKKNVTVNP